MNPDVSRDFIYRSQTPYIGGSKTGKMTTYLDELTYKKHLPLRQQTSKPILRYEPAVTKTRFSNLGVMSNKSDVSEFSKSAKNGINRLSNVKSEAKDALPPSCTQQIRMNQQNSEQHLLRLSQYNRPVSASETAGKIHGSKIKHNISASVAVSSLPEMSSVACRPEKLQRNSFLRPLYEASSNTMKHITSNLENNTFSVKQETYDSVLEQKQHNFDPNTSMKFGSNKNIAKQASITSTNVATCPVTDHHISTDSLSSKPLFASPSTKSSKEINKFDKFNIYPFAVSGVESRAFNVKQAGSQYDIASSCYGSFPSDTYVSTALSSVKSTDEGKTTSRVAEVSENTPFKKVAVKNSQSGLVYYRCFSEPKTSSILASGNTNSSNMAWHCIHEPTSENSTLPSQILGHASTLAGLNPSFQSSASFQSCIRFFTPETGTDVKLLPGKTKVQTSENITQIGISPKPPGNINSMMAALQTLADTSPQINELSSHTSKVSLGNLTQHVNESKVFESRSILASVTEQRSIGDGAPACVKQSCETSMNKLDNDGAPASIKQSSETSVNKLDKDATTWDAECDGKESDCDDDDVFTGSQEEEEDKEENRSSEFFCKGERSPGDGAVNEEVCTDEDDELESFEDNTADDVALDNYSNQEPQFQRPMTADSTQAHTYDNIKLDYSVKAALRPVTGAKLAVIKPAFRHSLFKNIPPTINFVAEGEKAEQLPLELSRRMKWKMSPITPHVVKEALARVGFKITRKNHDWLGCFGKHMKSHCFKSLHEYQKLNHFPGSFQIGRKDKLWRSLSKLQIHFGKQEFNFFPQTFVLPSDLKLLKQVWEEGSSKQKWIIKPPASARGIGIHVISKWCQVPRRKAVIVQKYIHRPFLINSSKFDMRIYVYVSCYDPLRLYVYEDGLARFASCKYSSSSKTLSNRFMHLTNYSVNKNNSEYLSNTDNTVCQGHKWSLKALWNYMKRQGINTNLIWETIGDLIIKTIISGDGVINSMTKSNTCSRYCCHELFGFDILLDEHFKPWILEVNISPSLHSNSPLDISIKGAMIKDMLNIGGFRLPDERDLSNSDSGTKSPFTSFCMDKRLFTNQLAPDERAKHSYYCQKFLDELNYLAFVGATKTLWACNELRTAYFRRHMHVLSSILNTLTPDDVRILCESIDEDSRKGHFQRLFPTPCTHRYLKYFEQPRYYNLLLDQWVLLYNHKEQKGIQLLQSLCDKGLHLQNPTTDPQYQWSPTKSTFASMKSDVRVLGPHNSARESANNFL